MTRPNHPRRAIAFAVAAALTAGAAHAEADADASTAGAAAQPTIAELMQRLEAQEQKIKVLERKLEIQDEATATVAASAPVVKASDRGFSITSADGNNSLKLRGLIQVDGRFLTDDYAGNAPDTWQPYRVRPIIEGTVGGIYDYRIMADFGQGKAIVQDAYVTARFLPEFQLTAGKFKSPVGLERLQSASDIRFVTRAFPTQIAPNRDIGLMVGGGVLDNAIAYQFAYLNGSNDGSSSDSFSPADSDPNSPKEWAGRIFTQPFANADSFLLRGLGVGFASTYTDQEGTTSQTLLPTFKTSGGTTFFQYRTGTTGNATATIADGVRVRYAPQLYYYAGPFGLMGEYTWDSQDVARLTPGGVRKGTMDNYAWQVAAYWFLTGEEQAYKGFKPNAVFSIQDGTWGAFELAARYHILNVDNEAFVGGVDSFADPNKWASKAAAWTVGLNWYLNQNLKWVFDYEQTRFDGGAPGGEDRTDEKAFLLRMSLGF
ncbi:MAG: porin [Steroidobacteraceae bacterium]